MPKYYEFKVAGYYLYFLLFALWNACMSMQATEDLRSLAPPSFLSKEMATALCRIVES